jgi:hypothetical protein
LTPVAEGVVQHEAFELGLGVLVQLRREIGGQLERLSRGALHALNLPAGSDINRLLTQIALVQREVRELAKAVEERPTPRGRNAAD